MEVLNRWFGSKKIVVTALEKIKKKYVRTLSQRKIVIADLGCGNGDLLRAIDYWAKKNNIRVELIGVDINPSIIQYAIEKSSLHNTICFKTLDILSSEFNPTLFDIIFINNVCHHFDDATLIKLLQQLTQQTHLAIVINDLQRHWLSYFSIKWLAKLLKFSYLAQNDGPLSVLRAFRRQDLVLLLKKANIQHYQIRKAWAFRWEIIIWCHKKDFL
jgi:2-polyprenyl-3-methyl-5-hydroxy-6-metoxy-1,4-benzoquinol methylase